MTPPGAPQAIIPYLAYADAPAAIDFLVRAFGFDEESRMVMEDGVEANEMDIELVGLTEMIAGHLVDD